MSAQMVVVIAGLVLLVAIVAAMFFARTGSGKYTYDTQGGTHPRASEGEGNTSSVAFKGRFTMLTTGVCALFGALVVKLWSMQMVSSDYYEEKARQNQTRTVTTPAARGRILDRNGEELVTNRPSLTVVAYRDLGDNTTLVHHLANVLGMPYKAVLHNIQDNTEGAQSLHTVAKDVRLSTVAYLQEHAGEFPGIQIAERTERLYPNGELAAHVLGYTGTITKEQLEAQSSSSSEESSDESAGTISYQSGDIVGQAGVEIKYESILQGIRGEQTVEIDANGSVTAQTASVPAKPGSDIKLTIDKTIQQACEDGLEQAIEAGKQGGCEADAGSCLCIDCTNGEILGLASYPKFDPSVFIGGVSTDVWNELNADDGTHPLINRVISGQYMSASTIKPLSALAGLEYGVYTSTQTTVCTGYWTGLGKSSGKYCWLHSGHGTQTLQQGIINSCDPVFYDVGKAFFYDENNPEGLQEMFRRWGLGESTGVDLPSESVGRVPDKEWKESYFKSSSADERTWNAGDMTNIVIGQGDILVTPMQMGCVYMGLANEGIVYTPHVFLSAVSRDGEGSDAYKYNSSGKKVRRKVKINSQDDIDLVKRGLYGVIYEESSSQASHFTNLSVAVAGKTGTGEKGNEDPYAWFCAYAPADDPKYVVVCNVEHGGYGSDSALHGVRNVLGVIYNEPDTSTAASDGVR